MTQRNARTVILIFSITLFTLYYNFSKKLSTSYAPPMHLSNGSATEQKTLGMRENCRVRRPDPFHSSIMDFIEPQTPIKCDSKPLTRAVYDSTTDLYTLEISRDELKSYGLSKKETQSLYCCYYPYPEMPTMKDKSHRKLRIPCSKFRSNITLDHNAEIVRVNCFTQNRKLRRKVHQDVHSTPTKRKKITHEPTPRDRQRDTFNVLLVGLDAVSYSNFQRQMPATLRFLRSTGWIEYNSYNKVEDNTLPNLIPILTGHSMPQLEETCWLRDTDSCPFVWKNFSARGYTTMYAEDEYNMSTFNFRKDGFHQPPVDFEAGPYILSATIGLKRKIVNRLNYCLGPTTSAERLLNYSLDFFRLTSDTRFFGVVWVNSLTHNSLQIPSTADDIMVDYFTSLGRLGVLDDTFIVFLSDHGIRIGEFRQTFYGWIEERLPFLFFHVPDRFRELYPEQVSVMQENAGRLTSPYEVHVTIHKVLDMSADVVPAGCPRCRGLFEPIAEGRSCADAGIPYDWCACGEFVEESTESRLAVVVGRALVEEINRMTYNKSTSRYQVCARFRLAEVMSLRRIKKSAVGARSAMMVIVGVEPGRAVFQAIVAHEPEIEVLGSVSRLDLYGRKSDCVESAWMKKYCHCVWRPLKNDW
ncbi:unnamed protein product [Bemisia tabaci]|uniref:Uncharacterized protein n=1 Tax=Bemisia tabaci TaxID=7038 RepID=A0A9P0EZG5_BEMTA|nr:unnamed protein product [Bemisia tabaci]